MNGTAGVCSGAKALGAMGASGAGAGFVTRGSTDPGIADLATTGLCAGLAAIGFCAGFLAATAAGANARHTTSTALSCGRFKIGPYDES